MGNKCLQPRLWSLRLVFVATGAKWLSRVIPVLPVFCFEWLAVPIIYLFFFLEGKVRMYLVYIKFSGRKLCPVFNFTWKNNEWLWEGGRVWDEEFRPGWPDYPTATSLQDGTLRRRHCIRIYCFILYSCRALVCDWGDELLSWLLFTCPSDLPLCQLLNRIVCRAFHQNLFWCVKTPGHD